MPSGYTAKIEDGTEESMKTFLTRASRGMGLYIMQRDEDFDAAPRARKESDYYHKAVVEATERVMTLLKMTEEEKVIAFRKAVEEAVISRRDAVNRNNQKAENYAKFINAFYDIKWPVSDDEEVNKFFTGFRKFVDEQLKDSYEWDVNDYEDVVKWHRIPDDMDQWYADEVAAANRHLEYSIQYRDEEVQRVKSQNHIHEQFMKFLDTLD